jgi:polar amino acid transport system substrate-binding protein
MKIAPPVRSYLYLAHAIKRGGRMYFLAILGLLLVPTVWSAEQVRACGGDNNWPPMSFIQSPSKTVEGISADLLRAIFKTAPRIELRPWMRCLIEVQEHVHFDVVMSAFKNPEREKQFFFSQSYHSLTPSYMYATAKFARPPISRLADLSRYKVCSLHGSSTFYTGLPNSAIESSANNYLSLQKKLAYGYCDIVVDMREVLMGFSKLALLPFDAQKYTLLDLPETEKYPVHFAVSRTHPQGAQLIAQIDRGLNELQRSGKLKALIAKYQAQP